ncbi:hypothetical protein AgCh_029610 [Apium graveolens]
MVQDAQLRYTDVFDAMVDGVHSAMEKAGGKGTVTCGYGGSGDGYGGGCHECGSGGSSYGGGCFKLQVALVASVVADPVGHCNLLCNTHEVAIANSIHFAMEKAGGKSLDIVVSSLLF